MEQEQTLIAAYVPFRTFETALNHLANIGGIPPRIDHTVFPNMGGLAKGQVISAFKFFRLIDENGKPSQLLRDLALDEFGRKELLRNLIKERYSNISDADLATMSRGQLDDRLSDAMYGASGATRTKVRAFLLKAAAYSGIPLSKLLTSKGKSGTRRKRTAAVNGNQPVHEEVGKKNEIPPPPPGHLRMPIALGPGRLAHIELPKDWDPNKELKKLLALLQLSLGGD